MHTHASKFLKAIPRHLQKFELYKVQHQELMNIRVISALPSLTPQIQMKVH